MSLEGEMVNCRVCPPAAYLREFQLSAKDRNALKRRVGKEGDDDER
jgi:hypothetical protein